jgi:poly(beta-D-mannuronate) lyase
LTTTTITSISTLVPKANAGAAGDTFLLADGTYDHVSRESITKSVIVKAANKGKAIIKGAPIDLNSCTFDGFDLQYSTTEQTVVKMGAAGTRLLNNRIHFANRITSRQDWFVVKGNDCILDGNNISDKVGMGNIILIGSGSAKVTGTKIRNNSIHEHSGGSGNGAETIRLGSSEVAKAAFNTEISFNWLENCSTSDDELITVKSSYNDLHDNRFINCNSGITFRHGSFNKYRNNKNINTGFRMYGHNQEITGNQFLRDSHSQLKQVVVGNADYTDDAPLGESNARYSQVHDSLIQGNWFIGEDATTNYLFCWGYSSRQYKPINNKVIDNIFTASKGTLAHTKDGASWSKNTLSNNILWPTGSANIGDMSGIKKDPHLIKKADGTYSLV